jgi:hypothetical protein
MLGSLGSYLTLAQKKKKKKGKKEKGKRKRQLLLGPRSRSLVDARMRKHSNVDELRGSHRVLELLDILIFSADIHPGIVDVV